MVVARHVARVYVGLLAVTAVVAVVTLALAAAPARETLGFTFSGVPATWSEAASIFLANLEVTLIGFAAAFVASWPRLVDSPAAGRAGPWPRRAADLVVAVVVLQNVIVVGAAVGAYGTRMVGALFPHGPVELLAFSATLALYLIARRSAVSVRMAATLGGAGVLLLALAAAAEAFL